MLNREAFSRAKLDEAGFLRSLIETMSEGVLAIHRHGEVIFSNAAVEEMFGAITPAPQIEWSERYGLFLTDQVTPYPAEDLPLWRALRGEPVDDAHIFARNCKRGTGCWLSANTRPWRDELGSMQGALGVYREIREHYVRRLDAQGQKRIEGNSLTKREKEVLVLIAQGLPTKEISKLLRIRFKTVGAHRTHIMQKLDIHEAAGLTRYAVRKGLIDP